MSKEEFLNYIIDFAVDTLWDDLKRREQLRALITSWCFIFGNFWNQGRTEEIKERYVHVDDHESEV